MSAVTMPLKNPRSSGCRAHRLVIFCSLLLVTITAGTLRSVREASRSRTPGFKSNGMVRSSSSNRSLIYACVSGLK